MPAILIKKIVGARYVVTDPWIYRSLRINRDPFFLKILIIPAEMCLPKNSSWGNSYSLQIEIEGASWHQLAKLYTTVRSHQCLLLLRVVRHALLTDSFLFRLDEIGRADALLAHLARLCRRR